MTAPPPRVSVWTQILAGIIGACFVFPAQLWFQLFVEQLDAAPLTAWQVWIAFAGMPGIFLLAILMHEGGHWVAGHLVGFRCMRFAVAWLHLERKEPTKWNLQWEKRPGVWGLVAHYPTHGVGVRRRKFVSVSSGPGANILTGGISWYVGITLSTQPITTATHLYLTHGLLFYALVSLFLGVTNLLPMTFKSGHRSDGKQLLDILRSDPLMQRQLAISVLVGSSCSGTRPGGWPAGWLPALLKTQDNTLLDCHAHVLAYLHYVDAQNIERAQHHLSEALNLQHLAPVKYQQQVLCEAAYIAAVYMRDGLQAQARLTQAEQVCAFEGNESYFIRSVVACAVGDAEEAWKWLCACEADPHMGDANDQGGRLFGLDRLSALRTQVQNLRIAEEVAGHSA